MLFKGLKYALRLIFFAQEKKLIKVRSSSEYMSRHEEFFKMPHAHSTLVRISNNFDVCFIISTQINLSTVF